MIEYPISLCLDEPTFAISACPIVAAEYVVIEADALTWDDPAYEVELTTGHPLRHELPEVNGLEAGVEYTWRARLKDGDDVWSCWSTETANFTQASAGTGRFCQSCTRVVADSDLASAKFGEQETDTSTIVLKAGTPGATSVSVAMYRTTISADNVPSETLLGSFSLQYPSGAGTKFAMEYKVLNGVVYILYVSDYSSTSNDSEVIYCYVAISAPTVVADSMRVVAKENRSDIRKELGLVLVGGTEFVGFLLSDDPQFPPSIQAYSLSQGVWSGQSYPSAYGGTNITLPPYKDYFVSYLSGSDQAFCYRIDPGTSIVHAVQERDTDTIIVYRLDLQSGAWEETSYTNPYPPTGGSQPVFVEPLPGDKVLRVLLAHYTPGVGAEVLSLSFNKTDLSRINSQVVSFIKQVAGGDPQPYISSLNNIGNGYVMMARTAFDLSYLELESFIYDPDTGELATDTECFSRAVAFDPSAAPTGLVSGLSLNANLSLKFHSNTKILAPVVEDPTGDYYMDGEYVRGSLVDFLLSLPAMLNREYGELIDTASGTTLTSVGAKGNPSNDTVSLTVTEDCLLTGLKVSATFDRSVGTVWASSAWIYIQELDYAFPLVIGDETYTPWPITITDLEVSTGAQFRAVLEASDVLTFEVFQSGSIGTITYSSLDIEVYTTGDTDVEECPAVSSLFVSMSNPPVGSRAGLSVAVHNITGNVYVGGSHGIGAGALVKFNSSLTYLSRASLDYYNYSYGYRQIVVDQSTEEIYTLEDDSWENVIGKYNSSLVHQASTIITPSGSVEVTSATCLEQNASTKDLYVSCDSGRSYITEKIGLNRLNSSLVVQRQIAFQRNDINCTSPVGGDTNGLAVNDTTGDVYVAGGNRDTSDDSYTIYIAKFNAALTSLSTYHTCSSVHNAAYTKLIIDQSTGDLFAVGFLGAIASNTKLLVSKYDSDLVHQGSVQVTVNPSGSAPYVDPVQIGAVSFVSASQLAITFYHPNKALERPIEMMLISTDLTTRSYKNFGTSTYRVIHNSAYNPTTGASYHVGTGEVLTAYKDGLLFSNLSSVTAGQELDCYSGFVVSDVSYTSNSLVLSPYALDAIHVTIVTDTSSASSAFSQASPAPTIASCGYS